MAGIPGKHIYELDALKLLKDDASIPISQDNLTRRVNLKDLRLAFSGDDDEPSEDTYYSSQYTQQKFSDVEKRFVDLLNLVQEANKNTSELKIYVDKQDMNLSENIKNLKDYVDNQNISLVNRITALENKVKNISKITIGSNIPTSLAEGEIYFQYF